MLNLVQIQDKLKDMPTRAIMAYANGQNPMVPPYLALGELNRRKQMEQSAMGEQAKMQGEPPTIKQATEEQLGLMNLQKQKAMMAQQNMGQAMANAPSPVPAGIGEEPVQMAGGGLARLPVRNIHRQAYAGGGIVAFADNQDQPVDENMPSTESNEELEKIRARTEAIKRGLAELTKGENWDPVRKIAGIGAGARDLWNKIISEPSESQAEKFRSYSSRPEQAASPKQEVSSIKTASQREKEAEDRGLADFDRALALFEQERADKVAKEKPTTTVASTSTPTARTVTSTQKQSVSAPLTGIEKYEEDLRKRNLDVMPESNKAIEALRQSRELYTREPDWIEGLTKAVQDMKAGQAVGSTRMREEKENRQALADLNLKIAAAEDLKVKSDYEFKRGNFDKAVEYERKAQELANQAMTARAHLISASKPSEFQQKIELYTKNPKLYSELFPKENPLVVAAAKEYFDKEILYKKDYPTVQDFLAAKGLTSSTQAGTPPAMPKEGDVAKSKSGKDIVFRGGNWEYK